MKKHFILVFLFVITISSAWTQTRVSGTVVSKVDGYPIPGVKVIEKGTQNGAVTSMEGEFTINVTNENTVLIFSFIGYKHQEARLNGRARLDIKLKEDCHIDFFDHQKISIYANSGIIDNPFGGSVEFSFPAFFRQTTLKSGLSFQTDLEENKFLNAQVSLDHLAVSCNFDSDINWFYRRVSLGNELASRAYSIETNLNFRRPFAKLSYLGLILGYSEIDLTTIETFDNRSGSAPLIGIGTWIGKPFFLMVQGKASIYKDLVEYQGEVKREFKRINPFIKFYKVASFTELSLGIGYEFTYRFRRQKM